MNYTQEIFDQIMSTWAQFEQNATKAIEKNNKSAAKRSRKASIMLERLLKVWRKHSVKEIG